MNIKQAFLGSVAIGGFLALSILYWAIFDHGGVLYITAIRYNEFWSEFIFVHIFLVSSIICFSMELISHLKKRKLNKLIFLIKNKGEMQYSSIKKFLTHLLEELNNQEEISITNKFNEFGFENEKKFEYFLRILQKQGDLITKE